MSRTKTSGLTKEIKIKRCYGCGAILQSDHKGQSGYILKSKLDSNEDQLCERCFKLRHYSEDDGVPHFNEDYATILKKAQEDQALIVLVTDAFSFEASLIPGIKQYLEKKLLLVVNKRDVLPKSYDDEKLLKLVKERLDEEDIHPEEVLLLSTLNNYKFDKFNETLNRLREGKDVYFIGVSQVGKSSIINAFLKNYQNKTDKFITTSIYPGTTIDVIQIPVDNDSYFYDTPGIFNSRSIINNVERNILKYIIPKTEIKPITYQSNAEQSYIIGSIARIDFISGDKTNLKFFISERCEITRTKLKNAEKTFDSRCITQSAQPASKLIKDTKDLYLTTLIAPKQGKTMLLINGLCCVFFEANGQKFDVYAPKNVEVKFLEGKF